MLYAEAVPAIVAEKHPLLLPSNDRLADTWTRRWSGVDSQLLTMMNILGVQILLVLHLYDIICMFFLN